MTVPARITQADIERATKAAVNAGIDRARIVVDLKNQKIEIIIGEPAAANDSADSEDWSDDDV